MALRFRIRPPDAAGTPLLVERIVDVDGARGVIAVGRRGGSDIELPFSTVSGRHAQVVRAGDGWTLVDLGSANGTFVGQRRLQPREAVPLTAGMTVKLADVTLLYEGERRSAGGGARPDAPTESTATLARRLVSDLFGACRPAEVARLIAVGGPGAAQGAALSLLVPGRVYVIGRAPTCDLVFADEDVSREHASFERRWDGVHVRDLGSKNGVQVRGDRISGESRLRDGDLVAVGSTRLRVDDPEDRYLRQMQEQARSSEGTQRGIAPGTAMSSPGPVAPPSPSPFPSALDPVPLPAPDVTAPGRLPVAVGPPTSTAATLARVGGRGPALVASVAAVVLAAIVGLMAYLVIVAR